MSTDLPAEIFKTKPYDHQLNALRTAADRESFGFLMEMGCVDSETEYLSPEGWVKISDYKGGRVAQFNLDGTAEFVEPLGYVKKPCQTMYHFRSDRGLDQMLSADHRMLVLRRDKTRPSINDLYFDRAHDGPSGVAINGFDTAWYETTPEKILQHGRGMSHVWPVFEGCHGAGYPLTEAQIRVQVAFHADGSFGTRDLSGVGGRRKGVVRVKRQHKVDRMPTLLEQAGIPFETRVRPSGFVEYWFVPPMVSKTFGPDWWSVNEAQKRIIADEVFRWDARTANIGNRGPRYSSIHKGDADFVQFCLASTGQRSSVRLCSNGIWGVHPVGVGRTSELVCIKHKAEQVPTPDGFMYCFRVPSSYLIFRRNGCIFTSGNTGKSKVLIDNMAYLYAQKKINFALVIAPKGVYRNWVSKEIPEHLSDGIPRRVIRWVANPNKQQSEELKSVGTPFDGLTIFVMNVEAFSTQKGKTAGEWLAKRLGGKGLIAIDESTTIKNPKAKRTKTLLKIAAGFAYRRILTGSPVTKSPMDVYAQFEFLGPRLLGHESFYTFQGRYAVMVKRSMGRHSFNQLVGYKNLEELTGLVDQHSFRVLKKDCLDLPEKVYTARYVSMTDEQRRMYTQIRDYALTLLDSGELVSTPQVITQMLRLQQVLSGHLKTDDGEMVYFPSKRMEALVEALDEHNGKAIIWSRFRYDIQQIVRELEDKFGAGCAAAYYGDTDDDERNDIVRNFQNPDHPLRFFVGNPATAGYGLTLTEANLCIYHNNDFNLETRIQSEDRAHRIGQKNNVTYIDLITEGTIDEKIVAALRAKIEIGAKVLGEEAREWLSVGK